VPAVHPHGTERAPDQNGTWFAAGWEEKMGLIPVAMMKWMKNLFVFLGGEDDRMVNPVGSIAIGTFLFQEMKGLLNIKGDRVNSLLEFPPLFLPCEVPLAQHLLSRHTD
jgi:hypothetical protein